MGLLDKFAAGLDQMGKKAAQALDEGKLRIDLAAARRHRDAAARDLGFLTYRQSKGEIPGPGDVESLISRIAAGEEEVAKIEAAIEKVRARGRPAGPAPEAAPPAADASSGSGSPPSDTPPGTTA